VYHLSTLRTLLHTLAGFFKARACIYTFDVNAVELNVWCALLLIRVSKDVRCKPGHYVLLRVGTATWRMSSSAIFIALLLTHIHSVARRGGFTCESHLHVKQVTKTFLEVPRKKATTYVLYRRLSRTSNHENENVKVACDPLCVYKRACK